MTTLLTEELFAWYILKKGNKSNALAGAISDERLKTRSPRIPLNDGTLEHLFDIPLKRLLRSLVE